MNLFFDEIGWSGDPFLHDDDIYDYFDKKRTEGNLIYENWRKNLDKKLKEVDEFKSLWKQLL